jgi:CRISPR/Cas system-associated exonuclease Cas4 (RecB family)
VIEAKARNLDLQPDPEPILEPAPVSPVKNETLGGILSPSQANMYLNCSAKWWFRHGLNLPDPRGGNMCRGTAVHKTVEQWFRLQLAGAGATVEDMGEVYDDAWDAAADETSFAADDDLAELKRQGAVLARKYLEEAAPEIQPAAIEQSVTGEIGGVPVRGYIDLVDVNGRIIDLKTSGRKPSGIEPGYAFQLATYQQLLPGANGVTRLDTLVATKTPQLVTIEHTTTEEERQLTANLYPRVREGIREGLYMPNRGSNLCSRKYCNFADACCKEFGGHVE